MKIVQQLGNSIHESIKLEIDAPSLHADHKLPMLDIKVWAEKDQSNDRYLLMHEFYQKPTASKVLIRAESAVPLSTKRTTIAQEILRVLL